MYLHVLYVFYREVVRFFQNKVYFFALIDAYIHILRSFHVFARKGQKIVHIGSLAHKYD
jgi:hypothetical protein